MPNSKNLRLTVENFGPLREGAVELKPLTILIGPNNSGKSYVALLLYVLSTVLSTRHTTTIRETVRTPATRDFDEEVMSWLEGFSNRKGDVKFRELPIAFQESIRAEFGQRTKDIMSSLEVSMQDYFGLTNIG